MEAKLAPEIIITGGSELDRQRIAGALSDMDVEIHGAYPADGVGPLDAKCIRILSSGENVMRRLNVPLVPTDRILENIRAWHWEKHGTQLGISDYAAIYEIITKTAADDTSIYYEVRINDDDRIDPVEWEEIHIDVVTAACLLMEEPKSVIVRWLLMYPKPTGWIWRGQEWIDKALFFQTLEQVRQLDQKAKAKGI